MFFNGPRFPYFTSQQMNLDWLLEKMHGVIIDGQTIHEFITETIPTALGLKDKDYLASGRSNNVKDMDLFLEISNGAAKKALHVAGENLYGSSMNDVAAVNTLINEYLKMAPYIAYRAEPEDHLGGFNYKGTFENPEEDTPDTIDGKMKMNCAVFSNLIMNGVPAQYSTYFTNNKKNKSLNPVIAPALKKALAYSMENRGTYPNLSTSLMGSTGLFTWKLARYLYDMGVLRPVGDNEYYKSGLGDNVDQTYNPGDILFFGSRTDYPDRFLGIYHCAVVVGYIGNASLKTNCLIAECTSNANDSGNITHVKTRCLRPDNDDMVVASFSPGYNCGVQLGRMGSYTMLDGATSYPCNKKYTAENVPCTTASKIVADSSLFSTGASTNNPFNDTFRKNHQGCYILHVSPNIPSSVTAATTWKIQYENRFDDWATDRTEQGARQLTVYGDFDLIIPYDCNVTVWTESNLVSSATVTLEITSTDRR